MKQNLKQLALSALIIGLGVSACVLVWQGSAIPCPKRTKALLSETGNSDAGMSHKVTVDWESQEQVHGQTMYNLAFTQDGKEWSLDYLTEYQYDSLLRIK